MLNLKGTPINQGIVQGSAYIKIDPLNSTSKKYFDSIMLDMEIENYLDILTTLKDEFHEIHTRNNESLYSTKKQLIDFYIAVLNDPIFTKRIPEMIIERKIAAQHVILEKLNEIEENFAKLDNKYFQSRFEDFKCIGYKILDKLNKNTGYSNINKPVIIVAESISAADLLEMPRKYILGLVSYCCSPISHAAILAENLDIPTVFSLENTSDLIKSDDTIIIDGYTGAVIINPTDDTKDYYKDLEKRYNKYKYYIAHKTIRKTSTVDDFSFSILANAGNLNDIDLAKKYKADGIGLLRTELIVLEKNKILDKSMQYDFYDKFLKNANMPVTIRTLDLGGDKQIKDSLVNPLEEDNPFLGFRSTRMFVSNTEEFQNQIEAILLISEHYSDIKILLPFITTVDDLLILKENIIACYKKIYGSTKKFTIPIGIMIEVPSTIICIEDFLPYVDFISVGTNDLIQYILAADRNNKYVKNYHKASHPAILKLLIYVAQICQTYNMPLSICGEMAKEVLYTRILLGLGFSTFSVIPSAIPMIKYILSYSSLKECEKLWEDIKTMKNSNDIDTYLQKDLNDFLEDHHNNFDRKKKKNDFSVLRQK